jgi:hypothetical protein
MSPVQRREVEAQIWKLKQESLLPVGMAPGYYSTSPFFGCGPLELEEFNLDYQGNLTLCCHLSGYSGPGRGSDFVGSIKEMSFVDACARFAEKVGTYRADKEARVRSGNFEELDHFPCWYCLIKYRDWQRSPSIPGCNIPARFRSREKMHAHIRTAVEATC